MIADSRDSEIRGDVRNAPLTDLRLEHGELQSHSHREKISLLRNWREMGDGIARTWAKHGPISLSSCVDDRAKASVLGFVWSIVLPPI